MSSTWVAAACAAGMAVLLSGCGAGAARIADVHFDETSSELEVITDTCNEDVVVRVAESDEIELSAEVPRRMPGAWPACQDQVLVGLKAPVGERPVVDGRSGRNFAPAPAAN